MKTKLLQIRVDEDFLAKLNYLRQINAYKSVADMVRKIIEKEYMKEISETNTTVKCNVKDCKFYIDGKCSEIDVEISETGDCVSFDSEDFFCE